MNNEFKQLSKLTYGIKRHILFHSYSSDIKCYNIIVVIYTDKHCIYCNELYKETIEDIPNLKPHTLYRMANIIVDYTHGYPIIVKNRFGDIDGLD